MTIAFPRFNHVLKSKKNNFNLEKYKISFFSVCQFNKARFIPENYFALKKFYNDIKYSVIIPSKEINQFKTFFKENNLETINLLNEEDLISITSVMNLLKEDLRAKNIDVNFIDFGRIGWYYQQVLKLSFLFQESKNIEKIVMIDADTIILKKLNFFKGNHSLISFSNYERNLYYRDSCEYIFKKILRNWKSSTVQLFAINSQEVNFLKSKLSSFKAFDPNESISQWLTKIIFKTILDKYKNINGSLFSEQDLISFSNILNGSKNKVKRIFIRAYVFGVLNETQKKIAGFLGYQYLTYEEYFLTKQKCNYKDFLFILLINNPLIYNFLKFLRNKINIRSSRL